MHFVSPFRSDPGLRLPHIDSVDFGWNGEADGRIGSFLNLLLTSAIVNDPVPVPKPHPSEGSYHWTFERFVISRQEMTRYFGCEC
jgi:hypothetical protein